MGRRTEKSQKKSKMIFLIIIIAALISITGNYDCTYVDKDTTTVAYQAAKDKHRNYVPTELLPVSTVGTVKDGNLVFVSGEIEEKKLKDIVPCSEEDITVGSTILSKEGKNGKHPYLVFDMYLRNLSNFYLAQDLIL